MMDLAELGLSHLEQLNSVAPLLGNELLVAAFLFTVTAGVIGLCVPGLLLPISFSAGMLMGDWTAVPTVLGGAVLGSHGLFLAARHGMRDRVERRLAGRMDKFLPHLERYGLAYVALLRVIGTPHFLVTLASAAGPLKHRSFALASILGFLPAVALAAGAGSAL